MIGLYIDFKREGDLWSLAFQVNEISIVVYFTRSAECAQIWRIYHMAQ